MIIFNNEEIPESFDDYFVNVEGWSARDPKYSWFHEPSKNRIRFLSNNSSRVHAR